MDLTSLSLAEWWPIFEWASLGEIPAVVVAALLSAGATLTLLVGLNPGGFRRGLVASAGTEGEAEPAGDCEFLVQGSAVRPLTQRARALLASIDPGAHRLSALGAHLERGCPGFRAALEELVLYGTPFRHHCQRPDGSAFEILGWPREGAARLAIRPASEDARALSGARGALERAEVEAGMLRALVDRAPILAWTTGADGQLDWANLPYRERFLAVEPPLAEARGPNGFAHVLEEVPLTARGDFTRRRVRVTGAGGGDPEWYEVSEAPRPEGGALGFALGADDLVTAEAALRRFIETLTETFAHLPIGLAVFDKNRRLGLFNPALTDLVKIDAVWLAGRPSLRDFLERLRETRQMPDQKDFTSWRRKLSELEEGAREGTYEENWVLPSGKIFRVTGRPHPQGAVAFLFEDISTAIQLERRYRSELDLCRATLARVSEAVAVFDAAGELVFVNAAYRELTGLAPAGRLDVAAMTRICAEQAEPSPVWTRLIEFATGGEARRPFRERLTLRDGREVEMRVAPLPDAASLVILRDLDTETGAAARDAVALAGEIALERLRLPAEMAARELARALPAAAESGAAPALAAAARGLREGLAAAEALGTLGEGGGGPLPLLAEALARRGLRLAVTGREEAWPYGRRRLALALGLAAADLARPGALITLGEIPDGLEAEVEAAPASLAEPDGIAFAIARRIAASEEGALTLARKGSRATLTLSLPCRETPAAPRRAEG